MDTHSPEVDHYLKQLATTHRHALEIIRELIHSIQMHVSESVQYRMVLFDYHGLLCAFHAEPRQMILYGHTAVVERYRSRLANVEVGKGSVRFQRIEDLPLVTLSAIFVDSCVALQNREHK